MLSSSNNLLFQIYMGEKYIITKDELPSIYKKIYKDNKINYYELDSVFPIGYATNKIINKDEFNKLTYPNNVINLLGNIVTNKETNTNIKELKETSINLNLISKENMEYEKKDYGYYIDAKKNALVNLKINDDLKGKILLLRFDILKNVSCNNKDLTITINNIKNKLTCSSWKYYNENTTFDYVLLDGETLNIAFEKGKYEIGNIKTYILDYEEINKINNTIDSFIIDKNKTKGDKIVGNIDVKEKSIFTLSIPYDKGFKIKVDSKEKPYYEVNEGFIGIDIDKGKHNIEIVYEAPYKKIGIIFTVIGLVLSAIIIISERSGIVEKNKYNSSML